MLCTSLWSRCSVLLKNTSMGSFNSTHIKEIHVSNEKESADNRGNSKRSSIPENVDINANKGEDEFFDDEVTISKTKKDSEWTKVKLLEEELAKNECVILDLRDQVGLLESQLQSEIDQQSKLIIADYSPSQKSSSDLYISRLEEEAKAKDQKISTLKIKLKKKVNAMSHKIAETRQEFSNKLLEQGNVIYDLEADNAELREMLNSASSGEESQNKKTQIIMELSQQVMDLKDVIENLQKKHEEKDEVIACLQIKLQIQNTKSVQECNNQSHKCAVSASDGESIFSQNPAVQEKSCPSVESKNIWNLHLAQVTDRSFDNSHSVNSHLPQTVCNSSESDWESDCSPRGASNF